MTPRAKGPRSEGTYYEGGVVDGVIPNAVIHTEPLAEPQHAPMCWKCNRIHFGACVVVEFAPATLTIVEHADGLALMVNIPTSFAVGGSHEDVVTKLRAQLEELSAVLCMAVARLRGDVTQRLVSEARAN